MTRVLRVLIGMGLLLAGALVVWSLLRPQPPLEARATVNGLETGIDQNNAKFARAFVPREFLFPRDHGPHPDFQTEWWYYTGNLTDSGGRHFGYQLTFFRRALLPQSEMPARESDFVSNQVYFAHFAVTDSAADQHVSFEKFSRGAAGLAGASGEPYTVFVEDWSAVAVDEEGNTVRLKARSGAYGIELDLHSLKPPVAHGNRGLSPKSDTLGNASYYYSLTRIEAKGRVQADGGVFDVSGLSWMDHEWSTSALGPQAQGWDWFSIQLSDQRELMFFRIRNRDGSVEPVSGGTLVDAGGGSTPLQSDQVTIEALNTWQSSVDGASYPVRWRITIPDHDIQLDVEARVPDQLMQVSVVYWEGAVNVTGQVKGTAVTGVGYVELTGYSSSLNGRF
ncbi:MAG: carotenoid 1,2-hydratase [Chloroflexi bacterium]|nr:carotenoid 1,2-hydratase [Chloroflexota bacterium]